jgi:plastocyanin
MLKPGVNLKLGLPLFLIAFIVSALALYGGAQLVKQDEVSAAQGGEGGPGGGPTILTLVAQNLKFDHDSIAATAGLDVTVTLDNKDAGVLHNVAFYTSRAATQKIAAMELLTGPAKATITFTAPASAGTFFFRCDVHPDSMSGAFVVR